jgi:large-conductance mechanosensitive channel
MKIHAQMRENTVTRAPKNLRYTTFGKVFMAFALVALLSAGFLAVKSISDRKNEQKQEAKLTVTPRQGDLYYGYFIENKPSDHGTTKML